MLSNRSLHAANVLVCIGGLATATGVIAGAGAIVAGTMSLRELAKRLPPATQQLSEDIARNLRDAIEGNTGLDDSRRDILYQMIEASAPAPQSIVDAGQQPEALLKNMQARLRKRKDQPDYVLEDNLSEFRKVVGPILTKLLNDPVFTAQLAPLRERAFWEMKATGEDTNERVRRIEAAVAQAPGPAISDPKALRTWMEKHSRETLEGLALRFGHAAPEDLGLAELKSYLISKAADLKRLEKVVAALEDPTGRIANLKAAAEAAISNGQLEEAKARIADALEIQRSERTLEALKADAALAEVEAEIALIETDHDSAFALFRGIAESFKPFDEAAFCRRCREYSRPLYLSARRYGGTGLARAAELLQLALATPLRQSDPWLWAAIQNNLANALRAQGERTDGPEGADLLAQAVTAYRAALEVRTRDVQPVDWAATQNNLANALQAQGKRTGGPEGAKLLAQAVTAYRAALEVCTRDAEPVDWAMAQNNLANALQSQGKRTDGPAGADLLAQAVAAYRAALEVHTRDARQVDRAATQNNLAAALSEQGERTGGPEGADLLAQAVAAYRAALEVNTRDAQPVDWAATQNNLAVALRAQGSRTGGPEGADLLAQAVAACRAALEVRTRDAQPVDWAMTQENLAFVNLALADHETCAAPRPHLEAALAHIEAALEVFDPVHMAFNHAKATELRDHLQARL